LYLFYLLSSVIIIRIQVKQIIIIILNVLVHLPARFILLDESHGLLVHVVIPLLLFLLQQWRLYYLLILLILLF